MNDNRTGLQGPAPDEQPHPDGRRNTQGIRIGPEAESEREPRCAVFSAIVEDEPGVLSHVTDPAARRQFNIEGLTVSPTTVEDRSRTTMVVREPEPGIDQVGKQLTKLKPIISVGELDNDTVRAEFVLLKVHDEDPDRVRVITEMYDGRTLDAGPETITVQLTGDERKVDSAADALRRFGIIGIARTGQTTLAHGSKKTVPGEEPGTSGEPTKPNTNTQ